MSGGSAFDTLLIAEFLDRSTAVSIEAEVRDSAAAAAAVYGRHVNGAVDRAVRSASRAAVSPATERLVAGKLSAIRPSLEQRFGVTLTSCEPPQFLRYQEGDFFVAHQDGNTPLIRDSSSGRRISAIVFLSPAEAYEGGALVFHGTYPVFEREEVRAPQGALLAFRSETTHEVTPVTRGTRCTIATWFR